MSTCTITRYNKSLRISRNVSDVVYPAPTRNSYAQAVGCLSNSLVEDDIPIPLLAMRRSHQIADLSLAKRILILYQISCVSTKNPHCREHERKQTKLGIPAYVEDCAKKRTAHGVVCYYISHCGYFFCEIEENFPRVVSPTHRSGEGNPANTSDVP